MFRIQCLKTFEKRGNSSFILANRLDINGLFHKSVQPCSKHTMCWYSAVSSNAFTILLKSFKTCTRLQTLYKYLSLKATQIQFITHIICPCSLIIVSKQMTWIVDFVDCSPANANSVIIKSLSCRSKQTWLVNSGKCSLSVKKSIHSKG